LLKIGTAAVTAASGAAIFAVKFGDGFKNALNGVQSSVGLTDEQMGNMKDTMIDIYNNNFGQNFEDIGVAMAEVAKQTGLADDKLQSVTENALLMRDSFGFEVGDSVRAASMMMDQFGVDGNTAYDLIAQGAQKGLDKNGDLLDTINEYSGQFSGMGFSAQEMFNMLLNGAASGTFSVDKLGDAVKEFGIRTKDGSDTSREAFSTLGLDADTMFADFAAGGETGKAAFKAVNEKLMGMTDPLEQNRLGVALYGTQWEDLGAAGVAALSNTDGAIKQTSENLALVDLNETKYDTFGEALAGIGRKLQTGILLPISNEFLPKLAELAGSFEEKMPQIQAAVESGIGMAKDGFDKFKEAMQFAIDNANILVPVIAGLAGRVRCIKSDRRCKYAHCSR
jgi:phage-related minor tail protein